MTLNLYDTGLLAIARQELLNTILPSLPASNHYTALMIANAMAIADRGATTDPSVRPDIPEDQQLCAQIRNGDIDPESQDYLGVLKWLRAETDHRLAVSNPKFLKTRSNAIDGGRKND